MTIEYRFQIDGISPAHLPMARLAEYMTELARLLGEPDHVHFVRLDEGSTVLVHRVDASAAERVDSGLAALAEGRGDRPRIQARSKLNAMLDEDASSGRLGDDRDATVIPFPGRLASRPTFAAVRAEGVLQGTLLRLGTRDSDGKMHATLMTAAAGRESCEITYEMLRDLREHLAEPTVIRLHGEGRYRRHPRGGWKLEHFRASRAEVLRGTDLHAEVAALQRIEGAAWRDSGDPIGELLADRSVQE